MRDLVLSISVTVLDDGVVDIKDDAGDNVHLNEDELLFLSEWISQYLGRAPGNLHFTWREE